MTQDINRPHATICLIEDDPIMGESLVDGFTLEGLDVDWHQSIAAARQALTDKQYGLVISDIRLPDGNGDELFESLRRDSLQLPPFIFITGYGDLARAVELLKLGAADYLTKPFDLQQLLQRVTELLRPGSLPRNDRAILGISAAMQRLEGLVQRGAPLTNSVLITGETGVGKEVVARYLHDQGRGGPFVPVNCAAFAEGLVESELFGHEKGAFTGATRAHKGVFEQAHGGTLFLDEIGDMPIALQARLLRVLQERSVTRVGGEGAIDVDLRLLCATHQDLEQRAGEGGFRADLLYRINTVQLHIPPLRERAEDVLWLARRFLDDWSAKQQQARRFLDPDAEQALLEHRWSGNVRELRHALERACIFSNPPGIRRADLFPAQAVGVDVGLNGGPADGEPTLPDYLRGCEKRFIEHCLAVNEQRMGVTAEVLGISRKALWEKIKRLGIERDQ